MNKLLVGNKNDLLAKIAPGGEVIITPLYIFYRQPLRKHTGWCLTDFTVHG